MDNDFAVNLLSTLGNNFRLKIFRMLIQAGEAGLKPSYISEQLEVKPNKLSFHLNDLKKHDLIKSTKSGRELFYSANYLIVEDLINFLFENCCNNNDATKCLDISKVFK